jgi:hypothetical protein
MCGAVLLAGLVAWAQTPAAGAEARPVHTVAMDRTILVGLDAHGGVAALRWQGPLGPDQLHLPPPARNPAPPALGWGIEMDGEMVWLGSRSAPAAGIDGEHGRMWASGETGGLTWRIALRCHEDALILSLEAEGPALPETVYFRAHLAPRPGHATALPGHDGYFDALQQVRLDADHPGSAQVVLQAPAPPDAPFAPGLGNGETRGRVFAALGAPGRRLPGMAMGPGACIWEVPLSGDGVEATVAFGRDADTARERLEQAARAPAAAATPPHVPAIAPDGDFPAVMGSAVATLRRCAPGPDAIVRSPAVHPQGAVVVARDAALLVRACHVLGDPGRAAALLAFLLRQPAEASALPYPAGAFNAGYFADGTPAYAHSLIDLGGTASVLQAAALHIERLDQDEAARFLQAHWPRLRQAGDFLAGWTNPRTGLPRPAFDWRLARDSTSPRLARDMAGGLEAALALATRAGEERSDWAEALEAAEAGLAEGHDPPTRAGSGPGEAQPLDTLEGMALARAYLAAVRDAEGSPAERSHLRSRGEEVADRVFATTGIDAAAAATLVLAFDALGTHAGDDGREVRALPRLPVHQD